MFCDLTTVGRCRRLGFLEADRETGIWGSKGKKEEVWHGRESRARMSSQVTFGLDLTHRGLWGTQYTTDVPHQAVGWVLLPGETGSPLGQEPLGDSSQHSQALVQGALLQSEKCTPGTGRSQETAFIRNSSRGSSEPVF